MEPMNWPDTVALLGVLVFCAFAIGLFAWLGSR